MKIVMSVKQKRARFLFSSRAAFYIIFVIIVFAVIGGDRVFAQYPNSKISISGRSYSKTKVVSGFLSAAVNNRFGLEYQTYSPLDELGHELFEPAKFKEAYPWLYPYLYETSVPKALAISKWTRPVKISLGFPNNLKPYNQKGQEPIKAFLVNADTRGVTKEAAAVARDEAMKAAPELSALTGLSVEFIETEINNNPNAISNLRIVMVHDVSLWATEFKYIPGARGARSGSGERGRNAPRTYEYPVAR